MYTTLAAFVAFCTAQDVTRLAGERRYVRLQREALVGRGPVVTVDGVMKPAVRQSVQQGLLYGVVTALVGLTLNVRSTRRKSRSQPLTPDPITEP